MCTAAISSFTDIFQSSCAVLSSWTQLCSIHGSFGCCFIITVSTCQTGLTNWLPWISILSFATRLWLYCTIQTKVSSFAIQTVSFTFSRVTNNYTTCLIEAKGHVTPWKKKQQQQTITWLITNPLFPTDRAEIILIIWNWQKLVQKIRCLDKSK